MQMLKTVNGSRRSVGITPHTSWYKHCFLIYFSIWVTSSFASESEIFTRWNVFISSVNKFLCVIVLFVNARFPSVKLNENYLKSFVKVLSPSVWFYNFFKNIYLNFYFYLLWDSILRLLNIIIISSVWHLTTCTKIAGRIIWLE